MQKVSEDAGITAFIDKRGRSWNMASYTDMLCRTSSMQIFHQAKTNEYLAHGEDLVIVSSHFPTCDKCAPWNGKVLSLTGETPGYPTMEEAKAAGLFHPNCRHTYGLYIQEEELGEIASNVEAQEDKSLQNASTELYLENAMKQMEGEYKDQFIEAFKDAPDDIVGVLGGYGSQLRIGPSVSSRISRYDPQTKTVMCAMNDSLGTINAIRHDSGHFIDHMIGREMGVSEWSGFASSCKEYSVACLSANMKYNPNNIFRRGNVKKMLKELEGVDYRTSPYLHDFVCSISMGRIETVVGHMEEYYTDYGIVFSESFADIFAMKAGNDSEGLVFVRKYFPDVLDTFNKILAGDFK